MRPACLPRPRCWSRSKSHSPPSAPLPDELEAAVAQINREMERVILRCPGQYMWGYARYRAPYGWGDYVARQAAQEEQQP